MKFRLIFSLVVLVFHKVHPEVEIEEEPCLNSSCGLVKSLSNGNSMPLVGMGVGNLPHEDLNDVINSGINNCKIRLIDTARKSNNEMKIARALANFERDDDEDVIHVITKVWYTHLGYDRTKVSLNNSMEDLPGHLNIRLHVLLHWPRCYDKISWMECEKEEEKLEHWIQIAGPPPHKNKANAWKESWRALEDIYTTQVEIRKNSKKKIWKKPVIESIGISNFEIEDMKELIKIARIMPHTYQGNLWKVVHDPFLMNMLNEHNIHFQAYNIMNGAIQRKSNAPNAFSVLTKLATELTSKMEALDKDGVKINESMILMSWLVQEGISVIPRASSANHQKENSPDSINLVPKLLVGEKEKIKNAVSALMSGKDLKVAVTFHNKSSERVKIHWKNKITGQETPVVDEIAPGMSDTINTHPGHEFIANSANSDGKKQHFTITAFYGEHENFAFDEL